MALNDSNSSSGSRRPATARRNGGIPRHPSTGRQIGRTPSREERYPNRNSGYYDDADGMVPRQGIRRSPGAASDGSRMGDAPRQRRPRQSPRGSQGPAVRGGYPQGGSQREGQYRESAYREESYIEDAPRRSSGGRGGHRPPSQGNGGRPRKKSKKTMILFAAEIVVIVVLLGFIYFVRQTSRVEKIRINEEAITIEMNQSVSTNESMKGYRNIAMFGVDSREGTLGKGTRSDTIIIASINQDTGDVRLCSVFRDTYLNLGNDSYNKCNAAYAQGGPEQAVIMLNKNLDMNITDYITVGFDGLIEVIDALGGIEINVTEAEIQHLNNYQISMVGTTKDGINFTADAGKDYTPVAAPGLQNLNGLQATAYCRIRYIGNDFQRAQRQRDVITAISQKAKKASVTQLNSVVNGVMDNVSTSLDVNEILEVAADIAKYNVTGSDGFPFEENRDTGRVGAKGDCVIPVDLKTNVVELHKFLFNEIDYQVSPEIETYSEKVASDTGKRKSS